MKYELGEFIGAMMALAEDGGLPSEDSTLTKTEFLQLVVETMDYMGEVECVLCGVDTTAINEYYMINNDLWKQYGAHSGMMCIGCLEERLGRKLTKDDFSDALLNSDFRFQRSERLADRLGG